MGEIRFVGTGETRGYPYLVCKKMGVDYIKLPFCLLQLKLCLAGKN